jgi:hypothetical protein
MAYIDVRAVRLNVGEAALPHYGSPQLKPKAASARSPQRLPHLLA